MVLTNIQSHLVSSCLFHMGFIQYDFLSLLSLCENQIVLLTSCQDSTHPRRFQAVTSFGGVSLPDGQSLCQILISTVFTLSLGSLMRFQTRSG